MDERLRRFDSTIRLGLMGTTVIGMMTFGRAQPVEAQTPSPHSGSIAGQGLPPCPTFVSNFLGHQQETIGPGPCELIEELPLARRTTRLYLQGSPLYAEVIVRWRDGRNIRSRMQVFPPQGNPPYQIVVYEGGSEQRAQYTRPSISSASERSSPERP